MSAIAERYAARVAAGEIESDPGQWLAVGRLARLEDELADHRPAASSASLGWLLARPPQEAPRGLYLWGEVGRGKTMLMDMFFAGAPVANKRRVHFHEFMAEVHERVRAYRHQLKYGEIADKDPITLTAGALAEETLMICFDEFHVTDIADAMILGRLCEKLFERGLVLVATSNVQPSELYKDGLNRALFLPFIRRIEERLEVVRLDARTDFRLEKLDGLASWHVPANDQARAAIDLGWRRLAGADGGRPVELGFRGRIIHVPRAGNGAARFGYADLCETPLGAADFVQIARAFHTVVVEDIPVIAAERKNEARRFILLIDTLYDNGVKLIASAAVEPDRLYLGTEGWEALEFRRTASRLHEMRAPDYLVLPHGRRDSKASGNTTGLVET
jgi:cell division protein ZapE